MIHSTAIISSQAKVSKNVKIGPFTILSSPDLTKFWDFSSPQIEQFRNQRRRAEKMINLQKEYLTLAKTDNYCCMHNNKKNSIPKEIKLFIKDPNKPCYNRLSRKYHPDKIALKKQLLINLLTNLPEELVDIIWSFYYNKKLNEFYCKIIVGFWNDLNELYISNRFNYI